jgi:hypothetical protein
MVQVSIDTYELHIEAWLFAWAAYAHYSCIALLLQFNYVLVLRIKEIY